MLIMIAMDLAPVLLCEKSQFLRPMTISLTACSVVGQFKSTIFQNIHELVHMV